MVKVRFAPSPTGFLHIGGARTALFNYVYAKAQGGTFVLRIEDTDRQRSKQEYLDEILDSMHWLGLEWDELYKQSERFDLYRDYAQRLFESGAAYEDNGAILFRMPKQEVKFFDIIRGEVVFDTANFVKRDEDGKNCVDENGQDVLKDEVLIKADGSPAYSFCCVVDDAEIGITHVIRGEDHIPNTPKQILMYLALGLKVPKFAHLPMILDEQGGKMSKRTGAVAVSDYREKGFLPQALVNYLMLLGWAPAADQEIISLEQAIKKFSIKKVNKAGAAFSMDKLRWINGHYLKNASVDDVTEFVVPFLKKEGLIDEDFDRQRLKKIVELYKSRMADISEFIERTRYLFEDSIQIDPDLRQTHLSPDKAGVFEGIAQRLKNIESFSGDAVEQELRAYFEQEHIAMSEIVHALRVVLTGSDIGPGLFETLAVLGKEKAVKRLTAAA